MDVVILTLSFALVATVTYLLFVALGVPQQSLIFSRSDATAFRERFGKLSVLFVVASYFGTLTSLATVYVFFLGTSKVFGWYVFAAPLTLALGFIVTNWVTKRIIENNARYAASLKSMEVSSGVIANIVWSETTSGRTQSLIIKWISVLSILGILWLEFSVFGDLARGLLGIDTLGQPYSIGVVFLTAFVAVAVILRYGLRGFVFADVLQSPIIIFGSFAVFAGLLWVVLGEHGSLSNIPIDKISTPLAPFPIPILFVAHVLVVNFSYVLVTESHWFRLWLFEVQEIRAQALSSFSTAMIWAILASIGCLAALLTTKTGNEGVIDLVRELNEAQPLLAVAFWLAASAALFSTADAQVYALLVVLGYSTRSGKMSPDVDRPTRAFAIAFVIAAGFAIAYGVVRHLNIPFEQLVFSITPLCSNALPALVAVATRRRPRVIWTIVSLALYGAAAAGGFWQSENGLAWTLAAALMPVLVSAVVLAVEHRSPLSKS